MKREEIKTVIENIEVGQEFKFECVEWVFGIEKRVILENEYIVFGMYGGHVRTFLVEMDATPVEIIVDIIIEDLENEDLKYMIEDYEISQKQ